MAFRPTAGSHPVGLSASRGRLRPGRCLHVETSSFHLPRIAPDHLAQADGGQDRAIDGPVDVADHKAAHDRPGADIEALHDPHRAHEDHDQADQGADDSHGGVEGASH